MSENVLRVSNEGAWFRGRKFERSIGKGGIAIKTGEGDNVTPIGEWRVEEWLVRKDRLDFDGKAIEANDRWCDDPADPRYNTLVKGPIDVSSEDMSRDDALYDLVGVVNYNRDPIIAGKGSAIFIHQWRAPNHPTEGCVAFAREDLMWIATNWQPNTRLIIQE